MSSEVIAFFCFAARIRLRFTCPGIKDVPFLSSSTLVFWSLVLILGMLSPKAEGFGNSSLALYSGARVSLLGIPPGSVLESESPCEFDLRVLVLLAASTRQLSGVHKSDFPSFGSATFSLPSTSFSPLESSSGEDTYGE